MPFTKSLLVSQAMESVWGCVPSPFKHKEKLISVNHIHTLFFPLKKTIWEFDSS